MGCSHPPLPHAVCSPSAVCTVGPRSAACLHRNNQKEGARGPGPGPRAWKRLAEVLQRGSVDYVLPRGLGSCLPTCRSPLLGKLTVAWVEGGDMHLMHRTALVRLACLERSRHGKTRTGSRPRTTRRPAAVAHEREANGGPGGADSSPSAVLGAHGKTGQPSQAYGQSPR